MDQINYTVYKPPVSVCLNLKKLRHRYNMPLLTHAGAIMQMLLPKVRHT